MINTETIITEASNIFKDNWKHYEYLTGDKTAERPPVLRLQNDELARDMLLWHINNKSLIKIHTDVDLDGIASCKILTEWLRLKYHFLNTQFFINRERVHGISWEHVNYFNNTQSQLVIVLDSSSNEIEMIKQLNCDILVIDHHKLQVNEGVGRTNNGTWVSLNYLSNSQEENPDSNELSLSAGMEVYEFLRFIDEGEGLMGDDSVLEDRALYQWAVATLFSDHMNNDNLRNIFWINKAFTATFKEPSLKLILEKLGRNDTYLSKSNIGYTLAPAFNKAVRAGASGEALDYAINNPASIENLIRFRATQDKATAGFEAGALEFEQYITKDITGTELHPSYAGLVATKLLDKYGKTAIVYRCVDGFYTGSFRGKSETFDYCECIAQMGFFAAGHPNAFGFKIPAQYIKSVMDKVVSYEFGGDIPYLAYGEIQGKHQLESLIDFRDKGLLWKLGIINSFMATDTNITAPSNILRYVRSNQTGTYWVYEIEGLEFAAFQEIVTNQCLLYAEHQDTLRLYVKNKWR